MGTERSMGEPVPGGADPLESVRAEPLCAVEFDKEELLCSSASKVPAPASSAGAGSPIGTGALPDAHFHLGFVADKAAFVEEAQRAGSLVFAASVTPGEYKETRNELARFASETGVNRDGSSGSVCLAVGLHPWWVSSEEAQLGAVLSEFDAALPETRFVGEVGLDFSKRRIITRDEQLVAFRYIAEQCAKAGGKILSIHCVKAYDDALRILGEVGCLETCTCIFHWFSGSSQQLQQTIKSGCCFSVGQRMLATKKGRGYVKAIPPDRLLLETDAPEASSPEIMHPAVDFSYGQMERALSRCALELARARGVDAAELAVLIRDNWRHLFL